MIYEKMSPYTGERFQIFGFCLFLFFFVFLGGGLTNKFWFITISAMLENDFCKEISEK